MEEGEDKGTREKDGSTMYVVTLTKKCRGRKTEGKVLENKLTLIPYGRLELAHSLDH